MRSKDTYYGDTACRGCVHWRCIAGGDREHGMQKACHYALDEKQLRGCVPGETCEKRKTRRRGRKASGRAVEITVDG